MTSDRTTCPARVGILILNYHKPEATLACVRRLLETESGAARVLWLENDADATLAATLALLQGSGLPWVQVDSAQGPLPPPGTVGVIPIAQNLGYAGGNNTGLRFLRRHGVDFAWIMNNDTLMVRGSSADLIQAAEARPEVGLWGMWVSSPDAPPYIGLRTQMKDFAVARITDPAALETDPLSFVNGCAMFLRTAQCLDLGGIPEEYFMYYEDNALTMEIRKHGLGIAAVEQVDVLHAHPTAKGRRSRVMEFYCRRNRWHFIHQYFPGHLQRQKRLFFLYQLQKLFFRLRFDRIRLECRAYLDFKAGRLGRSHSSL
jgi:GT2 family glycosyltransferase